MPRNAALRDRRATTYIAGLRQYLAEAAADPTMSLDLTKVARRLGVTDDTLRNYRWHPEVAALLERIEARRHTRFNDVVLRAEAAALPGRGFGDAPTHPRAMRTQYDPARLTDEQLATQIRQRAERACWAMQAFLGRQRGAQAVKDVRLLSYDLDQAVRTLAAINQELRLLAREHGHRAAAATLDDSAASGK